MDERSYVQLYTRMVLHYLIVPIVQNNNCYNNRLKIYLLVRREQRRLAPGVVVPKKKIFRCRLMPVDPYASVDPRQIRVLLQACPQCPPFYLLDMPL